MKKLLVLCLIPIFFLHEIGAEEVFNKTLNLELLKEYEKFERTDEEKKNMLESHKRIITKKQNNYQSDGNYIDNWGREQTFNCNLVNNGYENLIPSDKQRYNDFCENRNNNIWGEHNNVGSKNNNFIDDLGSDFKNKR